MGAGPADGTAVEGERHVADNCGRPWTGGRRGGSHVGDDVLADRRAARRDGQPEAAGGEIGTDVGGRHVSQGGGLLADGVVHPADLVGSGFLDLQVDVEHVAAAGRERAADRRDAAVILRGDAEGVPGQHDGVALGDHRRQSRRPVPDVRCSDQTVRRTSRCEVEELVVARHGTGQLRRCQQPAQIGEHGRVELCPTGRDRFVIDLRGVFELAFPEPGGTLGKGLAVHADDLGGLAADLDPPGQVARGRHHDLVEIDLVAVGGHRPGVFRARVGCELAGSLGEVLLHEYRSRCRRGAIGGPGQKDSHQDHHQPHDSRRQSRTGHSSATHEPPPETPAAGGLPSRRPRPLTISRGDATQAGRQVVRWRELSGRAGNFVRR